MNPIEAWFLIVGALTLYAAWFGGALYLYLNGNIIGMAIGIFLMIICSATFTVCIACFFFGGF